MCGLDIENRKGSSLLKTEDSERAITLQSINASELANDEASAHQSGHALNKFSCLNKELEAMEKGMGTVQKS